MLIWKKIWLLYFKKLLWKRNYYKLDIKINNKYPKENIRTKKSKPFKISLVDSLNLLNSNLDKLAKDFKVETKKGNFPHFFVTKKNLNYIGNKPDISYYNSISEKKYNEIKKNNWSLKQECLSYLHDDLNSLLQIMNDLAVNYLFTLILKWLRL